MSNGEDLLTTAEVAERLRVSRMTVSRWVRAGQIRAIRLPGGRALRFHPADVDAILAQGTTEAVQAS